MTFLDDPMPLPALTARWSGFKILAYKSWISDQTLDMIGHRNEARGLENEEGLTTSAPKR
jgi:hypothetical protein